MVARRFEIFALLMLATSVAFCQNTKLITFKKDRPFVFFQQGIKKDTITQNKGDLFYLQVPDSLVSNLVISVENAKLDNISGDTLIRLTYVKGHKYESFFTKEENSKGEGVHKFTTAVNGASSVPEKEIRVTFIDKLKNGKVILENRFIYQK